MAEFKIQCIPENDLLYPNLPAYDFCYTILKSIEYQNWINNNQEMKFKLTPDIDSFQSNIIPIGSVEFVHAYMSQFNIVIPKPINIPQELAGDIFLDRKIKIGNYLDIPHKGKWFIKSMTKIKGFIGIVDLEKGSLLNEADKEDQYLISEVVNIQSEWRGFFHNNILLDIKNYSGNPFIFPNTNLIKCLLEAWKSKPIAGTIDVAILENGRTVLIECHNFYSCGLYGFQDYRKLPIMFSQWWYQYLNKCEYDSRNVKRGGS